jgi:sigma-B regulation protein RsbU (phosphoserine phosphatase)
VTAFYGQLGPDGDLEYCNAGHNPPFLVTGDAVRRLEAGGTVMGLFDHGAYETGHERVRAGDLLVLYSDGVTEAENPAGEEVGDDRLVAWLRQAAGRSATEVLEAVQRDLAAFCGSAAARDDVTLMALRVL